MEILAVLVGAGIGLALYYFLAYSSNLEWSRKDHKFHNWEKQNNMEYNRVTRRWEKKY